MRGRRGFPGAEKKNNAAPDGDRKPAAKKVHFDIIPFFDLNSDQISGRPPPNIKITPAAEMMATGKFLPPVFSCLGVGEGLISDSAVAVRSIISRLTSGSKPEFSSAPAKIWGDELLSVLARIEVGVEVGVEVLVGIGVVVAVGFGVEVGFGVGVGFGVDVGVGEGVGVEVGIAWLAELLVETVLF